ncbi:MAG: anthranilate phosphoribosyltransferase [Candidatus Pelagibacter sp. TMED128]|nr:MAG: anthranilate phosphoribosyltransferase [Candidatus Pelagibacter sp. TMED128]|tara:strand:+ start:4587 stop:5582 length:996 start_codon:yes stop_codon:yes gene_type:complete
MSQITEKLKKGENLSFEESKALFSDLMEGKYPENLIIEVLESFIKKGETKDELAGGIFVLRSKASKVKTDSHTIDTCGTGGDGKNSLNISTAAAIVLASMGIKVAKHGNKAVSSNCGSADVLQELKININLKPDEAEKSINEFNFAFMFAPNYHSAMKHVGPARKKIQKKTIFNLIGPLSNPAQVKRQVVGVFDKKWMRPFAEALRENNVIHAYIVHSDDGMDEISPFEKTTIIELNNGNINEFIIDPQQLGIKLTNKNNLTGKSALYNSQKIIEIFKGKFNEFSQAVALNVAAGLIVSDNEYEFKDAFKKAESYLKTGNVFKYLTKIQMK